MLLEFSVTNFRSIKEKQTLSLLKTKKNELENNFTAIPLSTGKNLDVLNSAVNLGRFSNCASQALKPRHFSRIFGSPISCKIRTN
jgi:AAA15 family ATPase/GTPase